MRTTRVSAVDHLVYGVGDLDEAIALLGERLGVPPAFGGTHPGGTHNALLALGGARYLEIIAPDPGQHVDGPLAFGVHPEMEPGLLSWAVRTFEIEERAAAARRAGYDPGRVTTMSRVRDDGVAVTWRMTLGKPADAPRLMPFLIDWADSPHPSRSAPAGVHLDTLRGEHPHPEQVNRLLRALDVDLPVTAGPADRLVCTLQSPRGIVELR